MSLANLHVSGTLTLFSLLLSSGTQIRRESRFNGASYGRASYLIMSLTPEGALVFSESPDDDAGFGLNSYTVSCES